MRGCGPQLTTQGKSEWKSIYERHRFHYTLVHIVPLFSSSCTLLLLVILFYVALRLSLSGPTHPHLLRLRRPGFAVYVSLLHLRCLGAYLGTALVLLYSTLGHSLVWMPLVDTLSGAAVRGRFFGVSSARASARLLYSWSPAVVTNKGGCIATKLQAQKEEQTQGPSHMIDCNCLHGQ